MCHIYQQEHIRRQGQRLMNKQSLPPATVCSSNNVHPPKRICTVFIKFHPSLLEYCQCGTKSSKPGCSLHHTLGLLVEGLSTCSSRGTCYPRQFPIARGNILNEKISSKSSLWKPRNNLEAVLKKTFEMLIHTEVSHTAKSFCTNILNSDTLV